MEFMDKIRLKKADFMRFWEAINTNGASHNPKVAGSNPASATIKNSHLIRWLFIILFGRI